MGAVAEAVSTAVDYVWTGVEVKIKAAKNVFKRDINFKGRVKQFGSFESAVAAFGGETVVKNVLNSVWDSRAKQKAGSIFRSLKEIPEGKNPEELYASLLKDAISSLETFTYSERGVGASKRLMKVDEMKQKLQSGEIKPTDLSPEEWAAFIAGV